MSAPPQCFTVRMCPGNVARFVNHSCEPNCQMQSVLVAGDSAMWHHVALFAIENVGPNVELTYGAAPCPWTAA